MVWAKRVLQYILGGCVCISAYGQNDKVKFYEIIEDDSIMLFFNERYHYVEKECSKYKRLTKIDKDGNYSGYFKDIAPDNTLLGHGGYWNAKKNGYFEIYHPTGKIFCRGNYSMGTPTGRWDFYFESGLPERTIEFTESDTLLIRLIDKKGYIKVNEGFGEFEGPVTGRSASNGILAKGKIINGKPDGKWTSTFENKPYCREEFKNGHLIKGYFPDAKIAEEKNYKNKSYLNSFLLRNYADDLEKFTLEKCSDSLQFNSNKYSYNKATFVSTLTIQLKQGIITDRVEKNVTNYWKGGERYIKIEFSHDKTGKPENFKLLSTWGQPFYTSITNALRIAVRNPPSQKMYLHLRLNLIYYSSTIVDGFSYRFIISQNSVLNSQDELNWSINIESPYF